MVRKGDPTSLVPQVAAQVGAASVYANADVTPYARQRDLAVQAGLGVDLHLWWGTLMHPPGSVTTAKGHTSRVFTPFHVKWRAREPPRSARSTPCGDRR